MLALEPLRSLERQVDGSHDASHHTHDRGICPWLAELRHVREVHAIPTGYQSRCSKHGRPAGKLLHHLVLTERHQRQIDIDGRCKHFAHGADGLVDAEDVVVDVAEVDAEVVGDEAGVEADELVDDVLHGGDGQAQGHEVALHVVEAADGVSVEGVGENVFFQLLQFFAEVADDGQQVVDDVVQNGV